MTATVNQIDLQIDHFHRLSVILESFSTCSDIDTDHKRDLIKMVCTRLRYCNLIFKEIIRNHGDEIPGKFNFVKDVAFIMEMTHSTLYHGFLDKVVTVSMCYPINRTLIDILEKYHKAMYSKPFWKFW